MVEHSPTSLATEEKATTSGTAKSKTDWCWRSNKNERERVINILLGKDTANPRLLVFFGLVVVVVVFFGFFFF